MMDDIFRVMNEIKKKEEMFLSSGKYKEVIEYLLNENIDDSKEEVWNEDVDLFFTCMYDKALEVVGPYDKEEYSISIKYKDKFIELYEVYGQGSYRTIQTLDKAPENYVYFEDIVNFIDNGEVPERTRVLDLVNIALDSMSLVLREVDSDVDIDSVKTYISNNLN